VGNAFRPIPLVASLLLVSLLACDVGGTPANAPTAVPASNLPASQAPPTIPATKLPATQAPPTLPATNLPATQAPATATAAHVFDAVRFKQDLDPLVAAFMAANNVAACSVALAYPDPSGNKLLSQTFSFGLASKATQSPATASTLYEIGSLSKLFTADVLALFVNQKQMGLDDELQKYLPASAHVPSFNQSTVTLRELATHTSGLPRTSNLAQIRKVNGIPVMGYSTSDELIAFLSGYQLTYAPGSQWLYSNFANGLLGVAEEKIGQSDWETVMVNRVAVPLGLPDTRATLSPAEKANLAQGYQADGQTAPAFAVSGPMLAAGGLRATIQDLATYLIDNIDPGRTKLAAALDLTQKRQSIGPTSNVAMGLGWLILNAGTPTEQFAKDGATTGFNSYIAFSRNSRTGFAVVCNGHNVTQVLAPKINSLLGASETADDDTP
jgi:CubicO group peptidase (beta-lactamase class C family)